MSALPFADRAQAGLQLAEALRPMQLKRPLILAIPRGGIEVAAPIAEALDADLDVIVVRKVGAPRNPELGLGAVGATGSAVLDDKLVQSLGVSARFLEREIEEQRREAMRRLAAYRGDRPPLDVGGRDVVVVDDGIATGGTVAAAGALLRAQGANRLVLAVPVAPPFREGGLARVREAFDDTVVLHTPEPYFAVGQWYIDFHQVGDDEVRSLLDRTAR